MRGNFKFSNCHNCHCLTVYQNILSYKVYTVTKHNGLIFKPFAMTMSSNSNTPKNNPITPLRLGSRRRFQAPQETPECYTKVTVETPGPPKKRLSKNKCDEIRNLTVAVRIRPMNTRELHHVGATNIVSAEDQTVIVSSTSGNCAVTKSDYVFPYDHVFWSCDDTDLNYSNQEDVFVGIGEPLLHNAFKGYNACLFAYGQTGSGKSYSMMGLDSRNINCDSNTGIIPRFCKELFVRISQLDPSCTATIDVSYFEIYNEKIHDLLSRDQHSSLKVREHPDWGPYVVNLSTHTVKSYEELRSWLLLGNENRATAATAMNEKSSRSHSIFSVELSILQGKNKGDPGRRSKVSLVDLAGSERLGNMNTKDEKLKQGVCINKSLLTLGKVICALADQRKGNQFVPYRESVLTWLLRESLGGNSLTCMLATITPASTHLDETLATLRYACQARSIVNRARINEQPHDRLIRELRSEVERLRALSHEYEKNSSLSILQIDNSAEYSQELDELRNKLIEKEDELKQAQESWENRYKETHQYQLEQLAEVQRKKEELESRVRVMSNLKDDNVNLSPYRTNFLEEVENILTLNNPSMEQITEYFGNLLHEQGFAYQLTSNDSGPCLNITDNLKCRKTSCSLNEIKAIVQRGDATAYIHNLNWDNNDQVKLTESQLNSLMGQIYNAAKLLKPHIDKDEKHRLAFARFMKSAQVLESNLQNSIDDVSKTKKAVSFRL